MYQYGKNVSGSLKFNIDAVDFHYLVPCMYEARPVCRTSMHDSRNYNFTRVFVRFDSSPLQNIDISVNNYSFKKWLFNFALLHFFS